MQPFPCGDSTLGNGQINLPLTLHFYALHMSTICCRLQSKKETQTHTNRNYVVFFLEVSQLQFGDEIVRYWTRTLDI